MYGISDLEGRTHFNMWCILGAPLMIGTDVRTSATNGSVCQPLSQATLSTLTNTEVIGVDQDPLCAVGTAVANSVYAKPLGSFVSGQFAVLLLNTSSQSNSLTVNWAELGLVPRSSASVRDLWAHQNLGEFHQQLHFTTPGLARFHDGHHHRFFQLERPARLRSAVGLQHLFRQCLLCAPRPGVFRHGLRDWCGNGNGEHAAIQRRRRALQRAVRSGHHLCMQCEPQRAIERKRRCGHDHFLPVHRQRHRSDGNCRCLRSVECRCKHLGFQQRNLACPELR